MLRSLMWCNFAQNAPLALISPNLYNLFILNVVNTNLPRKSFGSLYFGGSHPTAEKLIKMITQIVFD
jgi:hypothetical protein